MGGCGRERQRRRCVTEVGELMKARQRRNPDSLPFPTQDFARPNQGAGSNEVESRGEWRRWRLAAPPLNTIIAPCGGGLAAGFVEDDVP